MTLKQQLAEAKRELNKVIKLNKSISPSNIEEIAGMKVGQDRILACYDKIYELEKKIKVAKCLKK